jgi:hypothetical protein
MRKGISRSLARRALSVSIVTAAVAMGCGTAAAAGSGCPTWGGGQPPNASTGDNTLSDVAIFGCSAWAVGSTFHGSKHSLIERWNGQAWKVVPIAPLGANDQLAGVAATSATNAWAVGGRQASPGAPKEASIVHWNGHSWQVQPIPYLGGFAHSLSDVVATSATNAWAVGSRSNSVTDSTLVEHWNGHAWTVQTSPNVGTDEDVNALSAVAATSATNAWAVGHRSTGSVDRTLILHWNGHLWKVVPSPNVGTVSNDLAGVAAVSATDAWAVGTIDGTTRRGLILHWNGQAWKVQSSPSPGTRETILTDVAATSATNAWAVGNVDTTGLDRSFVEHWNGHAWKVVPSPKVGSHDYILNGVDATSATNAWAVGAFWKGPVSRALVLQLHCC